MDKPVIILSGGILGSLLAYRLKAALPHIPFKLYQESSTLGNHELCSFRQSDCEGAMKWLRPFISQSWPGHQIKFPKFQKWLSNPYHLIDSKNFHTTLYHYLGAENVHLNNPINLEHALRESSFVIDARSTCLYKKKGYRKYLNMEVELTKEHHMIAPVIFDGGVEKKEHLRSFHYLPLAPRNLLVKELWYSDNNKINLHEMRNATMASLSVQGWRIFRVFREDSGVDEVPISDPIFMQKSRLICLGGLTHDTTGCPVSEGTRLIDKMIQTSFRLGELKEIVSNFRKERERDKKFFRFLNRLIIEEKQQVFEAVYQQPYQLVERFTRGELTMLDRSKIIVGKSNNQMKSLLSMVLPYSLVAQVELTKEKNA